MLQYLSNAGRAAFEAGGADGRMKRAIIILIAAMSVLLVCPTTDLQAKSPSKDAPTKSILPPTGGVPLPPWIINNDGDPPGGGEPGDADDLAGNRERDKNKLTGSSRAELPSPDRVRFIAKIWWWYFMIRLY